MAVAFFFPGQGAQHVGMGADLAAEFPEAGEIGREADEVLGYGLSALCAGGPAEMLSLTEHAQPAILMTSVMTLRVLQARTSIRPAVVAGHSLGEYTALVAAGALDFSDALRIVHVRGRLMQEAVPAGVGAMAAIAGLDEAEIERVCADSRREREVLEPANFNGAGQVVIAGHAAAVERAALLASERGARLVRRLPVSAPFHCSLMEPAAKGLADVLEGVLFRVPAVPFVSSIDGMAVSDPSAFPARLARQVERPIRWDRCVERIVALGCSEALEVGPDNVLSGLARRMKLGVTSRPVGTAAAMRKIVAGEEG